MSKFHPTTLHHMTKSYFCESVCFFSIENFYTFNWNSLPRFYPIMMLPIMLIRMRSINTNMQKVLKRASWMPVQVQNILIVLYWLLFVVNFCGGLLRSAANFNLGEVDNWVSGDGLYDTPLGT